MASFAPFVGVDILEPSRLADRLDVHPDLIFEIFRNTEIDYCQSQSNPIEHLATRFCAKEAVMKALGLDGWNPLDIEVVSGGDQASLVLHDEAGAHAELLGVRVTISMSHLQSLAIAVALVQPISARVSGDRKT
jgi:holo-[acyl-carrier protein] synthase